MNAMSSTAKQLIYAVIAVCFAALMAGLAVIIFIYRFDNPLAYAAGLILGAVLAAARVVLLERSIIRSHAGAEESAALRARLGFTGRYALTAAVLTGAAITPGVSLIGALAGVLSLRPAAYLVGKVGRIGGKE